jgi:hypothetical protein
MGKGADMGDGNRTARKRAVGTREHILAHLAEVGELFDQSGMASTQLAAAVGYPGSSVAFAQLLSGMERAGLVAREVRGKRTYRISLGRAHATGLARLGGAGRAGRPASGGAFAGSSGIPGIPGVAGSPGVGGASGVVGAHGVAGADSSGDAAEFDYDELARRLLVQVVRRLAATEPETGPLDPAALRETVTGLEHELASAWTKHGKLAEENVRLREQLVQAQRSLALAREQVRRLPVTPDLDSDEVVLLQRLLSPSPEGADGSQDVSV